MRCEEIRDELIEIARGSAAPSESRARVMAHARGCEACLRLLEAQRSLTSALGEVARQTERAPASVERMLLRDLKPATSGRIWLLRWAVPAFAAALLLAIAIFHMASKPLASQSRLSAGPVGETDIFVPLPYADPVSPNEASSVVRVEMQRGALLSAGLPVAAERLNDRIVADVLIGQDGTPRAIRLAR